MANVPIAAIFLRGFGANTNPSLSVYVFPKLILHRGYFCLEPLLGIFYDHIDKQKKEIKNINCT